MDKVITIVRIIAMLVDAVSQWVRGTTIVPDVAKAAALRAELLRMNIAVALAGKSVEEAIARTKNLDPNPLNAVIHRDPESFEAAVAAFELRQGECVTAGRHTDDKHCVFCKGE